MHPLNRIQVHGKGPRNGEVICHRKVQQSFLNQSLDTPVPLPITPAGLVSYAFSDFRALKGKTILTGASCLSYIYLLFRTISSKLISTDDDDVYRFRGVSLTKFT